jgi:primosomal replication protein N
MAKQKVITKDSCYRCQHAGVCVVAVLLEHYSRIEEVRFDEMGCPADWSKKSKNNRK